MAINKEQLAKDCTTFSAKQWKSEENKNLLLMVLDCRLNIAPCTLYQYDKQGLNHLEIISLSQCTGKRISTLPTADIDFLNHVQDNHGLVFGYEKKIAGKYHLAKVDHACYSFSNETPQGVFAIFGLDLYKVKQQ